MNTAWRNSPHDGGCNRKAPDPFFADDRPETTGLGKLIIRLRQLSKPPRFIEKLCHKIRFQGLVLLEGINGDMQSVVGYWNDFDQPCSCPTGPRRTASPAIDNRSDRRTCSVVSFPVWQRFGKLLRIVRLGVCKLLKRLLR